MSPPRKQRWLLRAGLLLAGLILGLGLTEGALRLRYADLPSFAGAADRPDLVEPFRLAPDQYFDDDRSCEQRLRRPRERDRPIGQGEPGRTIWFTGDSMTAGMGVGDGEPWPDQLAEMMSARLGESVLVRNLGAPGIGYCEVLRRMHSELQFGRPDVAVITLFADDLEARALLARDGRLIGLPGTIQSPPLRWLASHSYAANLAWFMTSSRRAAPKRFIDPTGRERFQQGIRRLIEVLHSREVEPLLMLLEPVGVASCTRKARAHLYNRCSWMLDDLTLMARLLEDADIDFLDLRGAWEGSGAQPIPPERGLVPAIHPDAAGHRYLAQVVLDRAGPRLLGADAKSRRPALD